MRIQLNSVNLKTIRLEDFIYPHAKSKTPAVQRAVAG